MPVIDSTVFFAITKFDGMCGAIFLISSIVSAAFYTLAKQQRNLHALMKETQTSLVRDLKKGPAKVAGRAIAKDHTLSSPWSNRKCVYYRFHVQEPTHNVGYQTYIDDMSSSSFLVSDETGEIEILVSEGQMDFRIDRNSESDRGNDLEQLKNLINNKYEKDTYGLYKKLRYTETYLEPDDKVFVFGQASQADDGRWVMRHGGLYQTDDGKWVKGHGEMPLIVSEKGELDVQTEQRKRLYSFLVLSIVLAVIAVGIIVFWVFQ